MITNQQRIQPTEHSSSSLSETLGKCVSDTVQAIARDNFSRKNDFIHSPQMDSLNGGIWYQNEYYQLLKDHEDVDRPISSRLKMCIQNNLCYDYYAPPKLLKRMAAGATTPSTQFVLADGVQASTVLDSLLGERKLALLGSTSVCQLGQYNALYQVLGREKFNKLFSSPSKRPFKLSHYADTENPLRLFLERSEEKAHQIGQRVIFRNVKEYREKHALLGDCPFIDSITLSHLSDTHSADQQRYSGLGLPPEGMTEEEVEGVLIEKYNKPPLDCSCVSSELQNRFFPTETKLNIHLTSHQFMASQTEDNQTDLEDALTAEGIFEHDGFIKFLQLQSKPITVEEARTSSEFGLEDSTAHFNVTLIESLVKLPLEKVSMDFVLVNMQKLLAGDPH